MIADGRRVLDRALALRPDGGQYVLQAAIASLQADADIDWHEVELLYAMLEHRTGSPVVTLSRAVAIAESGAPGRALELVDSLDLGGYRYLHSTRAELLRRLGRTTEAREAYTRALALAATEPEAPVPRPPPVGPRLTRADIYLLAARTGVPQNGPPVPRPAKMCDHVCR
ncbi:tetratricopeptide repeat protein [Nocardia vermiculata]|uniref:tetratricopeptide repeat protein n=1 Tax=Nocardia vermiculata TaxID=257274 RepID=UPI00082C3078|nr:tetratricopeptide repeat protein [Nocardia vermiculata]